MGSPDARRALRSSCDRRLQPLARGRFLRGGTAAALSPPPPAVATLPPLASPSPVVAISYLIYLNIAGCNLFAFYPQFPVGGRRRAVTAKC